MIPTAKNWLGRAVRWPLRFVPPMKPVRILSGPLAGKQWLSTAATHGCWIGTYERELQLLMMDLVRPGQVVYDIGANVGFFTLLAAQLVGPAGKVIAVEPLPRNLDLLRRHLAMNRIDNVVVVPSAAGDAPGTASFEVAPSPSMGRLGTAGQLEVAVTTIDALVAAGEAPPPALVKMDIEGGESRALAGAAQTLARRHPILLLSTHGEQQNDACRRTLEQLGYAVRLRRDGREDGQYELVAMPPLSNA